VKYDEENDIIEVFDVEPGINERIKKHRNFIKIPMKQVNLIL
jgi:hypothetical protein